METKPSPRCPNCGQALRRMRLISDLYRLPDLHVFECTGCDMSLIEGAEDLE
jgi:Ni,Fe-hydrogenase I small subunit